MSNCKEKMGVIISSSTANEWPEIDDQNLMASTNMGVDKPTQEQIQQALKCPRCDSSNTKFCYYNNYSLSQPRHFCKACKRYWTRGGTLRNVPVGGGCRKNKRVKRAVGGSTSVVVDSSSNNSVSSATMTTINPNSHHSQIDHGCGNPLFFHGLQHNNMNLSSELNLSFNSTADHVGNPLYEYDIQPQMSSLGFSSSGQISMVGGDNLSKSLLSNYHHLPNFGVSGSPIMASLLSSSNLQQKNLSHQNGVLGDNRVPSNKFLGFSQYENHMQMQGSEIEQIGSSDPNSPFWNRNGVGSWLDPANVGSSIPSLI